MGFIEESGAPQHWRDSRIAPIYEGTNGIQAMDLVMRKIPLADGAVVRSYFDEMQATADQLRATGNGLAAVGESLSAGIADIRHTTDWLLASTDPNDNLAGATPYLRQFGIVAGGYYLARSALVARRLLVANGDDPWLQAKIDTCIFYGSQILPQAAGSAPAVTVGAEQLFAIDDRHARSIGETDYRRCNEEAISTGSLAGLAAITAVAAVLRDPSTLPLESAWNPLSSTWSRPLVRRTVVGSQGRGRQVRENITCRSLPAVSRTTHSLPSFPQRLLRSRSTGWSSIRRTSPRRSRTSQALLPEATAEFIDAELTALVDSSESGLGYAAVVSIIAALWSASAGTKALITGIDIAYETPENRPFIILARDGSRHHHRADHHLSAGGRITVTFLPDLLDAVGAGESDEIR